MMLIVINNDRADKKTMAENTKNDCQRYKIITDDFNIKRADNDLFT